VNDGKIQPDSSDFGQVTMSDSSGGASSLPENGEEVGFLYQPKEIGGYEILSELGRGGMGVVYLARQRSLNRLVAIKMLIGSSFVDETQRLRFKREAELIAALKHPNIVAIHEISEFEGVPYYCMDYIEGVTFKDLISSSPLDWKEAAKFLKMVASAMQFAHEHGVLHRDLKPHNIMVDTNRHLQVTDFGLARDMNIESGLTVTGATVGTPSYMSPEQLSSDPLAVTASVDIYAMGTILYESLTSIPPFIGGSLQEVLEKVKYTEPLAPRLINPSFPQDLNTVCLKCLQKDPSKRYASALELAEELDRVLQDIPVRAKPIGSLEKLIRWCRRNRALSTVVIASTTIIMVGSIGAFWKLNQRRKVAESALRQADISKQEAINKTKEKEAALSLAESEKKKAEEALTLAESEKKKAEEATKLAEKRRQEEEEYYNNLVAQKKLTEQAVYGQTQQMGLRQEAEKTLVTAQKTTSELLADKAKELMDQQDCWGAYQRASEVLKSYPDEVEAIRVLAGVEVACFNPSAAISWLERARKISGDPEVDGKILDILHKFQPVVEKLPNSMEDRELQLALVTNILDVGDPLFSDAATYLRNTDPSLLNEKLEKVRRH